MKSFRKALLVDPENTEAAEKMKMLREKIDKVKK